MSSRNKGNHLTGVGGGGMLVLTPVCLFVEEGCVNDELRVMQPQEIGDEKHTFL